MTTKYNVENLTFNQGKSYVFFPNLFLSYQANWDLTTLFCISVYPQIKISTLRVNKRVKFPNLKTKLGKLNQETLNFIFAETFKNNKDERV